MALSLVTSPTAEPLTLEEARQQLREPDHAEDGLIDRLVQAARDRAELATGRQLLTATWDLELDGFPSERWIELPKPPLSSITSVTWVKYLDTAGVLQTWAASNYVVKAPAGPRCARGRVVLAYGASWPTTQAQAACVTVRFIAGYGSAATVPALLKVAMLLDLSTLFEHREQVILGNGVIGLPGGVDAIYRGSKSWPRQVLPGYNG